MGNKKRVSACTLGCKVNQYDTTAMVELLVDDGFEQVPWGEMADVYLINTCTVTNTADKKSRNMIRRAVKQNRDAVVCVCGCLAQKQADELMAAEGIDAVIGTHDRANIVSIVRACMEGNAVNAVTDIARQGTYEELSVKTSGELTRGHIKIQEGCNNFCSYCIIPYVRGRVRSRRRAEIKKEAAALAGSGVKEIVLTGIHISSYGQDTGETLIDLLRDINGLAGVARIRLGSLEPHILTEDFLAELSKIKKVCPHFHVSLQSGSTTVLKRMNRHYTAREYADYIARVRRYYDRPAVTTDLITGFPQETEDEFRQTCDFVREIGFSRIHVFPYSEREGTPAARMEGGVAPDVRKRRARVLIELGRELADAYAQRFLGTVQHVLFEQEGTGGTEGYTDRYLRIEAPGGAPGECRKVLLREIDGDIIRGEIV